MQTRHGAPISGRSGSDLIAGVGALAHIANVGRSAPPRVIAVHRDASMLPEPRCSHDHHSAGEDEPKADA